MDIAKLITNGLRGAIRKDVRHEASVNESMRCGTHREAGASEQKAFLPAVDKDRGYHYLFCSHNKLYFVPCTGCNRSKADAARHLAMMQASGLCQGVK